MTAAPEALLVAESAPQVAALQPAPDSVQVTPLPALSSCTVAVKGCFADAFTLAVPGDTSTTIGGGAETVMVADADFVVSATEVAVKVTGPVIAVAGAEYVMAVPEALLVADSAPQAAPLQPVLESAHVTPLAAESPWTVAVNCWIAPIVKSAFVDDSATEMAGAGAINVTVVAADFVPSAIEVAVTVTVAGVGTVVGAV